MGQDRVINIQVTGGDGARGRRKLVPDKEAQTFDCSVLTNHGLPGDPRVRRQSSCSIKLRLDGSIFKLRVMSMKGWIVTENQSRK